jgi:hypothetical protein
MWAQLINALLGMWLMAAPAVLGYIGPARTNDRIIGPLAAGAALIAIWETTLYAGSTPCLAARLLAAALNKLIFASPQGILLL